MPAMPAPAEPGAPQGSAREVLGAFLKLGLSAFGGPVAHLGYFRTEFVERRRWLDDARYMELVALCQFLPGPASSQVGMALGLGRAGWRGALAAWLGFTLPSALALVALAYGLSHWTGLLNAGVLQGLKVVAVAVVAQALWGMSRTLCPDRQRAAMALAAALLVIVWPSTGSQLLAIGLGAVLGWRFLATAAQPVSGHWPCPVSRRTGAVLLLVFVALLLGLPLAAALMPSLLLSSLTAFYQAGSLVFGGGHVVLPLLQASVVPPGWVGAETFVAGYGAAQAVPGPLFSFAAFLGAAMPTPLGGWLGGLITLVAIFLPSFLLVGGALPFWEGWRQRAGMQRAMAGIQAAVVGVLAAALYDPVWTHAIHDLRDLALALLAYGLLVRGRVSPVWVVALAALSGAWLGG